MRFSSGEEKQEKHDGALDGGVPKASWSTWVLVAEDRASHISLPNQPLMEAYQSKPNRKSMMTRESFCCWFFIRAYASTKKDSGEETYLSRI